MRSWSIPIALSLASAATLASAAPPGHVEIDYVLRYNGTARADIVTRLEHDAKTYRITESWRGRGLLYLLGHATRTSRGTFGPEGLRPLEFTDERTARSTARAVFDWSARTLKLSYGDEHETRPMPNGAQDRLSSMFDAAFRHPGEQPIVSNVTDGRGVSQYVYDYGGRERVVTPAGTFDAVVLVRRKDTPQDRDGRVWLAVDRDWLPVRVLVTDPDGTSAEQIAARIVSW